MNRRGWTLGLLVSALGCKPEPARVSTVPQAAAPKTSFDALVHLQEKLDAIERLGREIFVRDALAATAGDELIAAVDRLPEGWTPKGWLTWLEPNAWRVDIVAVRGDEVAVVFEVDFSEEQHVPKLVEPPRPLTGEAMSRWKARQLALEGHSPQCTPSVNPVVIPAGEQGWMVYLLPGTTDASVRILGGHVQVWVGLDGKVREAASLTETCLIQQRGETRAAEVAALMVTHVLTDHPREHHVFASRLYGVPIFVQTRSHLWKVEDGEISVVEEP